MADMVGEKAHVIHASRVLGAAMLVERWLQECHVRSKWARFTSTGLWVSRFGGGPAARSRLGGGNPLDSVNSKSLV